MQLGNKLYDRTKYFVQIILPALATLYFGLSQIWGENRFPSPEEVMATFTAIATFLGIVLGISNKNYKSDTDGFLGAEGVDPDTGHPNLQLVVTKLPEDLLSKDVVRLKVGQPPTHRAETKFTE